MVGAGFGGSSSQGYGMEAKMVQPGPMPPLRSQLSLIADNLAAAMEQVTRIEDALVAVLGPSGGSQPAPTPNTIQELVNVINDRVLSISNRLGRVSDKL